MNSIKNQRNRGGSGGSKSKIGSAEKTPRSGLRGGGMSKKDVPEMEDLERFPKDEL